MNDTTVWCQNASVTEPQREPPPVNKRIPPHNRRTRLQKQDFACLPPRGRGTTQWWKEPAQLRYDTPKQTANLFLHARSFRSPSRREAKGAASTKIILHRRPNGRTTERSPSAPRAKHISTPRGHIVRKAHIDRRRRISTHA